MSKDQLKAIVEAEGGADGGEQTEELVSKPKSKSKSKSKELPVEPTVETEEEVKPKSKSRSKSGSKNKETLHSSRLDELRALLKEKGIDASSVEDPKLAQNILQEYRNNDEKCGEDNDFECGDVRVCDVSVKPGVCIDKSVAKRTRNTRTSIR
jgi:hypothetical protein